MKRHSSFFVSSDEEMKRAGEELGKEIPVNSIIALSGDLGAGKTTFVKGLARGAANIPSEQVISPTFTYLNIYTGDKTIYHFDLYRLRSGEEFFALGFEEYFEAGAICCIEWAERIKTVLPKNTISIHLSYEGQEGRMIKIS